MSKTLDSKTAVVEWYWPDFLNYCIKDRRFQKETNSEKQATLPTIDNFWVWYITKGPMGLKEDGHYYTKDSIEYV
jgi:hypothetical protein